MNTPIVATADWHLVDGSRADDSCPDGIEWAIEEGLAYQPRVVAMLGDGLDGWLAPLSVVVDAHSGLLHRIDRKLADADVTLIWTVGNHEAAPASVVKAYLRSVMPRCDLIVLDGPMMLDGWTLMHGHSLDPWCRGPQSVLGELGAVVGGLLERVIPGFDESLLNPTRLTSPARAKRASVQTRIHEAADKYVAENGGRVLHGHTHRRRISEDRNVVCAGSCTKGRGEFAVVWPDGNANLIEMGA